MEPRIFRILIEGVEIAFSCKEDETVFAAMLRCRERPISQGCCGGGCGICRMKIVKGSYEQIKPMSKTHIKEQDKAKNRALLCCIQPRSDMIIAPG